MALDKVPLLLSVLSSTYTVLNLRVFLPRYQSPQLDELLYIDFVQPDGKETDYSLLWVQLSYRLINHIAANCTDDFCWKITIQRQSRLCCGSFFHLSLLIEKVCVEVLALANESNPLG